MEAESSPENVTGKSPQSIADSKATSDSSQEQPAPKAPNRRKRLHKGVAPAASERPTSKEENVETAHRKWTQSEKYHFWLNVSLVVIGVLALPIYYGQLVETRKSTDAATKAAKAAEDSITLTREMSRLDQRAWVAPIAIGGIPEAAKPLTVSVTYKNSGKTFARNVRIAFFAHGMAKGKEPNFARVDEEPKFEQSNMLLAPGVETTSERPSKNGEPITEAEMKLINSGELEMFVYGKITYMDVFDCPHWTTFCGRYNKRGKYDAYNKYNDADNNPPP